MKDKTAFICGITGQDSSYLSELLLGKGYKVYGLIRRSSVDTKERIVHLLDNPDFELVEGDITDAACMHRLISGIQPTEVYNLAAQSNVGTSFDQPILTAHVNAVGPLNILEAIRQSSPKSKFYQASTSELFGNTTTAPQNEDTPFNPNSPYGVAKLFAHHTTTLYRRAYGIFACAGILYNHESERRGEDFVTRKITKYVAGLKNLKNIIHMSDRSRRLPPKGNTCIESLSLGNIEAQRDWSHAKDMVRGMWMMMQHSIPDDYVLGSGKTHSVKDFLQAAFSYIGLDYETFVIIDPKLYRPVDVNLLQADSTKAKRVLGWETTTSFSKLVRDMIDSDYERIKNHA